jgi:hypothetical protein
MDVAGHARWRTNTLAVSPAGSEHATLLRRRGARRAQARALRRLAPGTPVVLSARGPCAGGRCRSAAGHAGIVVERQYLAFPSAEAAAYLVEDAAAPVRLFVRNLLVAPPGSAVGAPLEAAFALVRALLPWQLIRVAAPGRVVVGRRT